MKFTIIPILVMASSMMTAQDFFQKSSINKEIKEEYIGDLFKQCRLIYCERDSIDTMTFAKEMEVEFFDTTFFFSARVYSSHFSKLTYAFDLYGCDSVYFDDGDDGFYLRGRELENFQYLKNILDSLIQQTPFVEYVGEYFDPED